MWSILTVEICSNASIGVFFSKLSEEQLDEVSFAEVVESRCRFGLNDGGLGLDYRHLHLDLSWRESRIVNDILGNEGLMRSKNLVRLEHVVSGLGHLSRSHNHGRLVNLSRSSSSSKLLLGLNEGLNLLESVLDLSLGLHGSLEVLLYDGGSDFIFFITVFDFSNLLHDFLSLFAGCYSSVGVLENGSEAFEFLKRSMVVLERHEVGNRESTESQEGKESDS